MALVAIVGMGGLGCPIAVALAEAGVDLRLIDDDRVELSNLQRQVLFSTPDIGRDKLDVAVERLHERFPEVAIEPRSGRLSSDNAAILLAGADLIIDATDDPAARFIVNDWGLAEKVPVVIGGVHRFQGMVLAHAGHGPCLRCLFEEEGPPVETCAAGGVIGAMAGLVGFLMAERALQLLAASVTEAEGDTAASATAAEGDTAASATAAEGDTAASATAAEGDTAVLAATGYVTTLDGLAARTRHVPLPAGCDACAGTPTSAHPGESSLAA